MFRSSNNLLYWIWVLKFLGYFLRIKERLSVLSSFPSSVCVFFPLFPPSLPVFYPFYPSFYIFIYFGDFENFPRWAEISIYFKFLNYLSKFSPISQNFPILHQWHFCTNESYWLHFITFYSKLHGKFNSPWK